MRRGTRRAAIVAGALVFVLAGAGLLARCLLTPAPPQRLTLTQARFDQLPGWSDERPAASVGAFLRSCAAFSTKADDAPLDPTPRNAGFGAGFGADFGRVGEWRPACLAAAAVPAGDDARARRLFESHFVPMLAGNNGQPEGLFTGYFEIVLHGSRRQGGKYQTPLYRRPPEPGRYTRAEIDGGALAGQGLELVWVDDPVDAFFLEIQGSGRIKLADGGTMRVNYDGANGKPYVAVGRLMVERGILPRDQVTMASIRTWMKANPGEGAALRRDNPSYVFFREIAGDGPIGAEQVVLTPQRSLAVDRHFLPLGIPIWLDAQPRYGGDPIRRLVVAQDTGGAIRGPVRGDFYWGSGEAAGAKAGAMNARGRYYLLLPSAVAARARQTAAPH